MFHGVEGFAKVNMNRALSCEISVDIHAGFVSEVDYSHSSRVGYFKCLRYVQFRESRVGYNQVNTITCLSSF